MTISRRALLAGMVGTSAAGVAAVAAVEWPRLGHEIRRLAHPVPEPRNAVPDVRTGAFETGTFVSRARGGRTVAWGIAYPPGVVARGLPVALVLHGRGDSVRTVFGSHAWDRYLAAAVDAGTPPFAVAAVDGGDHGYWHRRSDGDDAGRMVLEEFVPMLAARGLRTGRIGLAGWSMGGYGALLLAERLGAAGCAAVAADSPALWLHPGDSAPGAFDGRADFVRNDVFAARPRLHDVAVRIAIGTSDPFYAAARSFVGGLTPRPEVDFSRGGHDVAFWRHSAPHQVRFLGTHLHGGTR